ncbi:class I SAM-dependent DNA methyltransferase [Rhizobium leguminosarum]|nr:class I SAM-dependent DNA methyltransferase [Rhizobium leguminosarum]
MAEFLPLDAENWIVCGNALRLDWLSVCPPTGTGVKLHANDLFHTPLDQAQIDFDNEGGETYICGNPPYRGSSWQTSEQKDDLSHVTEGQISSWKSLDYVAGWFVKAAKFVEHIDAEFAFVSTKSICEGEQVPILWPFIYEKRLEIQFAHAPFNWSNLASNKAGVTVVIVGVGRRATTKRMYDGSELRAVSSIGPYLAPNSTAIVAKTMHPIGPQSKMLRGNMPTDGGNFLMSADEVARNIANGTLPKKFVRAFLGASEVLNAQPRYCLWIETDNHTAALQYPFIRERVELVRQMRLNSSAPTTRTTKVPAYRFMQVEGTAKEFAIAVPAITSENREFLPAALLTNDAILSNKCYALYDAPLWNFSLVASSMHRIWIGTVCARMRSDFSYSNTLGWNTFPVPTLTEKMKADLTRCAEDILLAREARFPATIADLYDPETMPAELKAAHERNDEVLERIYIGRRFRNDTERLEKLFDLYSKMTADTVSKKPTRKGAA